MNKSLLDTLPPWPWKTRYSEAYDDWEVVDAENTFKGLAAADSPVVALVMSLAPELIEALQFCECELTLYQGLAEQSENPQAWYDAIAKARVVLNKLKGKQDEQPTLF